MFSQLDINSINSLLSNNPIAYVLLFLLSIWSLTWKGFALWKASRNSQKKWFIALLILNTFGILEIIYIFYFQPKEKKERKESITKE